MIGTKLYPKKSRTYFLLAMYGVLSGAGVFFIAQAVLAKQNPSGAAGFMLIFGAGMFIMTLIKSRRPQISIYENYLEVMQARTPQVIRYKSIVSVSRPDKLRLLAKLWEDGLRKDAVIWLKDLDPSDADRLLEFLSSRTRTTS